LENIKIPTEKEDKIIPYLRQIKQCYGIPLALVHDMGPGILLVVKEVFPGVADHICHYHFLRDIGNNLMGVEYARIRSELTEHSIRPSIGKIVKATEESIEIQPELAKSLVLYLKEEGKTANVLPRVLTYILSHWILDANSELKGYGFPFDRSHLIFYKRLRTAGSIITGSPPKKKKDKYIIKLNRALARDVEFV
jgi:hypothetical protein